MNEANVNGVNVVASLSTDNIYEVDNVQAKFTLERIKGRAANSDVEILSTADTLFMHNKKTGYGFFAHFD